MKRQHGVTRTGKPDDRAEPRATVGNRPGTCLCDEARAEPVTAAQALPTSAGACLSPAWQAVEASWLSAQASPHTRRHYHTSWVAFACFVDADTDPRRITSDDVNAWMADMRARGLTKSTIVSRVAACASLFDFVTGHAPELLTDRRGHLCTNPFRNEAVRRPRVQLYSACRPLSDGAVQRMLCAINGDCLSGARDRALLLTALTTGWQTTALLGLRWMGQGDGGPGGEVVDLWQGSEAGALPAPLPPAACDAVRHYLVLAGRWPLAPGDCVWLPLRVDGAVNFGVVRPDPLRPISGTQANNILRRRLAAAGVSNPEQYHLRDLRHTFARKYLAAGGDAAGLGSRLRHARTAVTQRYVARLALPVDDGALTAGWL